MKGILGSIVFEILVSLGLVHWEYVASGQPASKIPLTTEDETKTGGKPSLFHDSPGEAVRVARQPGVEAHGQP
jgi:hypothetical protein